MRENGSHATTRLFRLINHTLLRIMATTLNTHSVFRSFNQNNQYITRYYDHVTWPYIFIFTLGLAGGFFAFNFTTQT